MSEAELIFTALAELSTRQITESVEATGLRENASAGKKGGKIAKGARLELESETGRRVVTGENFLPPAREEKTEIISGNPSGLCGQKFQCLEKVDGKVPRFGRIRLKSSKVWNLRRPKGCAGQERER